MVYRDRRYPATAEALSASAIRPMFPSGRTLFRYFTAKEDLVLHRIADHNGEAAQAGLDRRDPVTGLNDHPEVLTFHRLVFTTPSLAGPPGRNPWPGKPLTTYIPRPPRTPTGHSRFWRGEPAMSPTPVRRMPALVSCSRPGRTGAPVLPAGAGCGIVRAMLSDGAQAEIPTDEQVAEHMLAFARIFVDGTTAEGRTFDWDAGSAQRLDGLCEAFLAGDPVPDSVQSMVLSMGAYLGELIVRHGGGRWAYDAQAGAAGIDLPFGQRCFPHNKVGKRLSRGPTHSLRLFYYIAVTGDLTLGTVTERPSPDAAG